MKNRLNDGIDTAVRFLAAKQTDYGEIGVHRYFDTQLTGTGLVDSSPFATTFALHALSFIDHPLAQSLRDRAIGFLMEQKEGVGLWRYWTSRTGLPIDPDLDDTCCASFALRSALPEQDHAIDNIRLILSNRNADGLFMTWLREVECPNDIDFVVNANILFYLGDRQETCLASDALVNAVHANGESEASHYYVNPLALHYAIARAYDGGARSLRACRQTVLEKIETSRGKNGDAWGNPMTTALALCTLAGFDAAHAPGFQEGIDLLLDSQQDDGSFARAAFYAGPEPPHPHSVYWGSEELTTALCLEAFGRCARIGLHN